MSISNAMINALSGLGAASRSADVIAANVANALTQGYARRELQVSGRTLGGTGTGVRVDGVARAVNQAVLNDKRLADAESAAASHRSRFQLRIETAIGQPGDDRSLGGRIAALEAAFTQASSRPDSEARLAGIVTSAQGLAGAFHVLQSEIQTARMEADAAIARQVTLLNDSLAGVDRLNAQIIAERASGRDPSALMDERQALVDRIAEIVPLREIARDREQIALFTTGGAVLLEGSPVKVGFAQTGVITPDMNLGSGSVSGLTLNGTAIVSTEGGVMGGGALGAALAIRDELAPALQAQIDAMARNLIERFSNPAVDATLLPGQPGLLTDAGAGFDVVNEVGLAGRIAVNAVVDPTQGGALWRLRDGLGAMGPGEVGDARRLIALSDALSAPQVPASGAFIGAARSASGLAADILSQVASARQGEEARASHATAVQEALTAQHLENGVDSDAELQRLLLVEEAFAANARVIQTMDELLQQIIRL